MNILLLVSCIHPIVDFLHGVPHCSTVNFRPHFFDRMYRDVVVVAECRAVALPEFFEVCFFNARQCVRRSVRSATLGLFGGY